MAPGIRLYVWLVRGSVLEGVGVLLEVRGVWRYCVRNSGV